MGVRYSGFTTIPFLLRIMKIPVSSRRTRAPLPELVGCITIAGMSYFCVTLFFTSTWLPTFSGVCVWLCLNARCDGSYARDVSLRRMYASWDATRVSAGFLSGAWNHEGCLTALPNHIRVGDSWPGSFGVSIQKLHAEWKLSPEV